MFSPNVTGLCLHRGLNRSQIGNEVGIFAPNGFDDDRTTGPDHRSPTTLFPKPLIAFRHQLVAQDTAVDNTETRAIARVHHLFRRVGVEVDLGLDAQNQYGVARDGQLQRSAKVSPNVDGVVRTRGNARPASNARVVDDLNVRFLHRHRPGRTRPDTREAGHTFIRVDFELHAIIRLL